MIPNNKHCYNVEININIFMYIYKHNIYIYTISFLVLNYLLFIYIYIYICKHRCCFAESTFDLRFGRPVHSQLTNQVVNFVNPTSLPSGNLTLSSPFALTALFIAMTSHFVSFSRSPYLSECFTTAANI